MSVFATSSNHRVWSRFNFQLRLAHLRPGGRHLLFSSDRIGLPGLWAQRVQDGTPAGEPQLLVSNFSGYPLGVTRDGTLHYAVRVNQMRLKTAQLDLTTGKFLRQPVDAVERFLGLNYWPTFSPDGETFAYVSRRPGGTMPIVLRSLKTGEERDLLPVGLQEVRNLRWSPGGPITVIGRDDLGRRGRFVVDVATGQTRPLGGPWRFLTPDGTEGFLTPDGTQILHKDRSKNPAAIYAYSVADGSFHTLPGVFGGERFESPDIKVGRSQRTGTTCAVSPAHLSSSNNYRLNTLRRLLAAAEQAPQPERGLRRRPSTEARKYCSGRSQKNP